MSQSQAAEIVIQYLYRLKKQDQSSATIRSIAKATGLSRMAVFRALQSIRKSADTPIPVKLGSSTSQPRWTEVYERISQDLLIGRYSPNKHIPIVKQLCFDYQCCFRTMRRALVQLVNEKRILIDKKRFRVPKIAAHRGSATIILLAQTNSIQVLSSLTPRSVEFWQILEKECLQRNINLVVKSHKEFYPEILQKDDSIIGILIFPLGFSRDTLDHLLQQITVYNKTVALLDETGDLALEDFSFRPVKQSGIGLFTVATSDRCGKDIGTFLLNQGHRHVVCFPDYSNGDWEKNRIEGIKKVYEKAKPFCSFELCPIQMPTEKDFFKFISAHAESVPAHFQTFTRQLKSRQSLDSFHLQFVIPYLWTKILKKILTPHFNHYLNNRSITAWIGITDMVALLALDFLHEKKRSVPGKIAVIGFDDTTEAFGKGLTSYNFNMPAVVTTILDFFLSKPYPKGFSIIDTPGLIMERASTWKAV